MIGPAIILAAILALFHVSAYVFVRGSVGSRLPWLLVGAFLGAWAGDALGGRLDVDPIRIGDFHVISASILAWAAIALVAVLAILAPDRRTEAGTPSPGTASPGTRP